MSKKVMIIAGEASGDLHGGTLVRALYALRPDLEIFGVGGDNMRNAGMELFYHVQDLAYIGFTEVIRHYFDFRRIFYDLIDKIEQRRPDILVLIDYPGFNLRFGKKAKAYDVKVFYFIAPQVWAWAQGRAKKMARYIDKMAVIFDFEVDFFSRVGLDTSFVGHPLLDGLEPRFEREAFFTTFNLQSDAPLLGLFPGSRRQELTNLLPTMLGTAKQLYSENSNLQVAVSQAPTIRDDFLSQFVSHYPWIRIVKNATYDLMQSSTAAIVCSGTATLETACFKTPFAIAYRVSPGSYFIGKRVVKIPNIGLANVVAGKQVAREFIQTDLTVKNLLPEMRQLLYNQDARRAKIADLETVREKLGEPGAAVKTAELILHSLNIEASGLPSSL